MDSMTVRNVPKTRIPPVPARARRLPATCCFLLLSVLPAIPGGLAGEVALNFDELVTGVFWNELYPGGGWTLYCGYRFGPEQRAVDGKVVAVDHVYQSAWIMEHLQCHSRAACRAADDGRFERMEADLHNIYPAVHSLTMYRRGRSFGTVDGEDWRFDDCDIEWRNGIMEPRPIARGNIARSVFYMHSTYGLPVGPALLSILKQWHTDDPPSRQERIRNDVIERLQGRRNPYVDEPSLARELGGSRAAD